MNGDSGVLGDYNKDMQRYTVITLGLVELRSITPYKGENALEDPGVMGVIHPYIFLWAAIILN